MAFNINATNTDNLTLDGQLNIGSSAGLAKAATLTAGSGISVTNGHNTITIAATGDAPYTDVSGTSATMVADNAYGANNAALVTLTLPTTAAEGSFIKVVGIGAGGWKIAQPAGVSIRSGAGTTTVGTSGSLSSTLSTDAVVLQCTTANTVWTIFSVSGNLTGA